MTTLLQVSINFSHFNSLRDDSSRKHNCCVLKLSAPNCCYTLSGTNIGSLHQRKFKPGGYRGRWSFLGLSSCKDEFWVAEQGWKRKKSLVVVRFNQGFRFNDGSGGGGGGGGGRDNGKTLRLLGNLAFAIGLTYLSVTGQLGWVLDTIVSIWLLAVLLPIVGLGAFIWWAGRDIVQGSEFWLQTSVYYIYQVLTYSTTIPLSVYAVTHVLTPSKSIRVPKLWK
ncbi:uncharacterized protein LOC132308520 isoform X2 [Cornus florida]|uniref:uncharacterized protein LOC132308520 isoform X2 n=1 Tax=Cornus florida TaxID=4283 RepID=UPI0028975C0B|nr:uncharacterized protein LOC132308520 isoform X2 [Cornus florida]